MRISYQQIISELREINLDLIQNYRLYPTIQNGHTNLVLMHVGNKPDQQSQEVKGKTESKRVTRSSNTY